ncbi:hypothetical protein AJ78_08453 [Emergomyces pasteurianus Ep9510]|uniref:CFEM domain-containing protein n=1 Tax=Emergomyces pasteurianus Ep9510 TaxID=1447872 RepID=A0A1J9Q2R6_9EURO|nr:hypothetical protein AJ78_08453 [Emergomyces pasteurianus Ep9510]
MQFSHALIALVAASLANAQLPDIPPCALACFTSAIADDGCTPLTNFKCHCGVKTLPGKITPCVEKACDVPARSSVSNLVVSICSAAGAPIQLPPVGEVTATDTTGAPTGKPTGAPTATPSPTGTPSPSKSTPAGVPSGTGSFTKPSSPPTGSPTPGAPGAGSNLNANIGGVAAALLAVAAYL